MIDATETQRRKEMPKQLTIFFVMTLGPSFIRSLLDYQFLSSEVDVLRASAVK
jgi:hypothetical protein